MTSTPILYSFRRCPYAIRARLAIASSGLVVELREIVLRDKAPAFLGTSPSGTVPCLRAGDEVLDESLDIMIWALRHNDPDAWLRPENGSETDMAGLVRTCDGPFKRHLDRYKYDTRHADANREEERAAASPFLLDLDSRLRQGPWLFGQRASLADYAILPFVRQFANTDRDWFDRQAWTALRGWLKAFEEGERFASVMNRWAKWQAGDAPVLFPAGA